jgi:cytochrome c-type biogenesis protein CcmH/NrfG
VRLPDPAQIPESRDVSHPPVSETNPPPTAEAAAQPAAAPAPLPVQANVTTNKEPRRTFLQRMNPVGWFEREKKPAASATTKTTVATPAPTPAPATSPTPPSQIAAAATPPPQPAALRYKRYAYRIQAPKPGNRGDALPRFSEAVQAQRSGDMNTAIAGYRAALLADPAFFEAWFNLGIAAYDLGQISQALTAYETALALRPDSRDVRYNFALALRAGDFPVDAAEELKKLLAGNPGEVRLHLTLGSLYALQLGQPTLARQHYQRVLASEPNHPQATSIRSWLAANPE